MTILSSRYLLSYALLKALGQLLYYVKVCCHFVVACLILALHLVDDNLRIAAGSESLYAYLLS